MSASLLKTFNLEKWVLENDCTPKPLVGSKGIFETGDLMVRLTAGPISRCHYHDDPVGRLFYQITGSTLFKLGDNGVFYDLLLKEGHVFVVPPHVRHSPQSGSGSVSLVTERRRDDDQSDAFEWYCFRCDALVHRIEVTAANRIRDLPVLHELFLSDERARTCRKCGLLHPGKGPHRHRAGQQPPESKISANWIDLPPSKPNTIPFPPSVYSSKCALD
jgi:3-hydroxyanthranilate 3,4-dioxygenase